MHFKNFSLSLFATGLAITALWSCGGYDDVQDGDVDYFDRSKTFVEEIGGQPYWFIPESDGSQNVLVTWNRINCNSIVDYVRLNAKYSGDVDVPSTVTHNGTTYTVTGADDNAFYCCNGITSLKLQEGMTQWGEHTWFYSPFRNLMTKVKEIYLPSTLDLKEIPAYYFMNNTALVTCHIPNVTAIGDSAFFKCSRLTTVNIPSTVQSIGDGAFTSCSKLKELHVEATTPPTLAEAVAIAKSCTLYVPTGSKDAYEANEFWSKFKTIKEE